MSHVTIVIPCYNEESRIPTKEYRRYLSNNSTDILFVNDGSKDRTLLILKELQVAFPSQVHILNMSRNRGKAEAVRRGILEIEHDDHNGIIGFMDADLSTPFEEVTYFLDAFSDNKVQFVFGSRISRIGARIDRFAHRHYFGRTMATLISTYLRIPIYDSQCGAKFFHASFARQLFMDPFVSRWLFDVEIFKRIRLLDINVEDCALELPLHTWTEKGGSKIRFKDYLKLPFDFLRIVYHYMNKKSFVTEYVMYKEIKELQNKAAG